MTFLLDHQSADGAWRDFSLKPGRSDAWVTAYVGLKLLGVSSRSPDSIASVALAAAARFVAAAKNGDGGWGYNGSCPPDADSTAWAILFLRRMHVPVELRDLAALVKFQSSDGGFTTYRGMRAHHGWGFAHPDVTVVALAALATELPSHHVILRKGYASLEAYLAGGHPMASYWWPSPYYMAWAVCALCRDVPEAPRFAVPPLQLRADACCFERALALEVDVLRGRSAFQVSDRAMRLRAMQLADGSWPSEPILRVADPRSTEPDDAFSRLSPVFADDRRIFTTATVMAATDAAERYLDARLSIGEEPRDVVSGRF